MGSVVKNPKLVPKVNGKYVNQLLVLPISDHQISYQSDNSCDDSQSETKRLCNDSDDENNPSINWILFKGILFSGLSGALFSMCSVIVKYLKVCPKC